MLVCFVLGCFVLGEVGELGGRFVLKTYQRFLEYIVWTKDSVKGVV